MDLHWNRVSYHFIQSGDYHQKMDKSQAWEGRGKLQPDTCAGRALEWAVALEKPTDQSIKGLNVDLPRNSIISFLGMKPKNGNVYLHKNCVHEYSEELDSPWSKRGNNPASVT